MAVLPELPPTARAVLGRDRATPDEPVFTGSGDIDLLCGHCGLPLARGLRDETELAHLVLVCGRCQSFNQTAPSLGTVDPG